MKTVKNAYRKVAKGIVGKVAKKIFKVVGISAIFIGAPILSGLINKKGDKVNAQGQEVDEKGKKINSASNKMKRTTSKFGEEFIGFWVFFEPAIRTMYNFTGLKNIDPSKTNNPLKKFGLKLIKGVGKIFGMGMNDAIANDAMLKSLHIMKEKGLSTEIVQKAIKSRRKELLKGMGKHWFSPKRLASTWGGRGGVIIRNLMIAGVIQSFFSESIKKFTHLIFGKPAKAKTEEQKAEEARKAATQPIQQPTAPKSNEPLNQGSVTQTHVNNEMMNKFLDNMKNNRPANTPATAQKTVENITKPVETQPKEEKKVDNYTIIPSAIPAGYQPKQTSNEVLNELDKIDEMIGYAEQITGTL